MRGRTIHAIIAVSEALEGVQNSVDGDEGAITLDRIFNAIVEARRWADRLAEEGMAGRAEAVKVRLEYPLEAVRKAEVEASGVMDGVTDELISAVGDAAEDAYTELTSDREDEEARK